MSNKHRPSGAVFTQSELWDLCQQAESVFSSFLWEGGVCFNHLGVCPQHWCFSTPPHREICFWEFRETKLWSVAALRNVTCIFVWHKNTQTPTTWSGRKRHPYLDYVFDQCKHTEEIIIIIYLKKKKKKWSTWENHQEWIAPLLRFWQLYSHISWRQTTSGRPIYSSIFSLSLSLH